MFDALMFISPRIILHLFASHVGFGVVFVAVLVVADYVAIFVDVVVVLVAVLIVGLAVYLIVALAPVYNAPISFCIRVS